MIIKTKYPNLVEFIFPNLRKEEDIPIRDGFFLEKSLVHSEVRTLENFKHFVVISDYFFDEEWDKKEIISNILGRRVSRRKPKFDWMDDIQFEEAVKLLYAADIWPEEDESSGIFELFKNIDSYARVKSYFECRKTAVPYQILYSVITFAQKCMDPQLQIGASKGYMKILMAKKNIITKNFKPALNQFLLLDCDPDMRVLAFLLKLGER
jgi:hypothetical protein